MRSGRRQRQNASHIPLSFLILRPNRAFDAHLLSLTASDRKADGKLTEGENGSRPRKGVRGDRGAGDELA